MYKLCLFFILLLGFGLRYYCIHDPLVHNWDERYHALVAKNMIADPLHPKLYRVQLDSFDYRVWSTSEIWMHKQPMSMWIISLSLALNGINEVSVRIPSLIASLLSIYFCFLMVMELYNDQKLALTTAFLYSINGLLILISTGRVPTDHVDTFFAFFILAAILALIYQRKKDLSKVRGLYKI